MMINRPILLVTTAISALMCCATAHAQTAAPAPAAQNENFDDNDIVVTALKRRQLLVDVPQAVTVVSGSMLENQQATNFSDYLKDVPGLQLTQGTQGFGRLVIRGINTGGVASTVGVYVDETPFGSSSGLNNGAILAGDFDTFDVARIEVLRGPQGTLYGANSLSGVLKFVTNAPNTKKFEARARAGVETVRGGDASYSGNAMINIPLGDTLAFRASGTYRKDGGFIDVRGVSVQNLLGGPLTQVARSNINGVESYGGRASLLFEPGPQFSIRLSAIFQNIDAASPSIIDANANTLENLYGGYYATQFVQSKSRVSYRVYNALITGDLGFATVTSSTSYAKQKQDFRTDATFNLSGYIGAVLGTPNNLYLAQITAVERYTEEVRLTSAPNKVFEWMIGGYFNRENAGIDQAYVPVQPGTLTVITTLPLLAKVTLRSHYQEFAGFANGTLHLGSMFDVDFGGRWSTNKQRADQTSNGALAGGLSVYPTARSSEDVFTYSIAPKIKLSPRAAIYARVARGFRPGGPNILPPAAPAGTPTSFGSDSLTSYEIGFKGETTDGKFALDLAAYHIDWNRIQLIAVVNGFGINVNGVGAKSDGLEGTATFRPTPGLDISLNGTYSNARLSGDTSTLVGGKDGDRLPFTPKFSFGTNVDYRWNVGGNVEASLGGSLRTLSKQNASFDNTYRTANGRQRQIPSYEVVDLRAGLDFGRFSVQVYARNLFDAKGKTSTGALTANGLPQLPNGAIGVGVIRPRSLGVSLTAGF